MHLIVVYGNPERSVFSKELSDDLKSVSDQREPDRVLNPVIVMLEGAPGIIGRVNESALYFSLKIGLQGLQREKVIAKDQSVIEKVALTNLPRIRLARIF
jgi:hypothetical protein